MTQYLYSFFFYKVKGSSSEEKEKRRGKIIKTKVIIMVHSGLEYWSRSLCPSPFAICTSASQCVDHFLPTTRLLSQFISKRIENINPALISYLTPSLSHFKPISCLAVFLFAVRRLSRMHRRKRNRPIISFPHPKQLFIYRSRLGLIQYHC